MSKLRVVHLSPTPLVGAPAKLASAQRKRGHHATAVALSDYPKGGPLAGKFVEQMLIWKEAPKAALDLIEQSFHDADVVHVHNDIPRETIEWLREHANGASFVYQVHSPLREGPLYVDRSVPMGLPFKARLVVGQYQPRHYPHHIPVPNLVLDEPSVQPIRPGEKLRVMFSPSHTRGGRWNAKQSLALEKAIRALVDLERIEVVWPESPVSPHLLMAMRKTCHVTIDEIVTGAFHQVSIEGMCAGNVVINRADFFSRAMMASCAGTSELPAFATADDRTIAEVLQRLIDSPQETARLQMETHEYYKRHLMPERLIEIYENVYSTIH